MCVSYVLPTTEPNTFLEMLYGDNTLKSMQRPFRKCGESANYFIVTTYESLQMSFTCMRRAEIYVYRCDIGHCLLSEIYLIHRKFQEQTLLHLQLCLIVIILSLLAAVGIEPGSFWMLG